MKKIAHRGYTTNFIKENTMEAFNNAINNNFEGFECDVRKTKDNVLVISHDATITRTSDGEGLVREMTYKELLDYNFGTKEVPSKIPTLESVLKTFKDTIKVIEIKTRIDLSSILGLIDDNTYFIGFDTSYIKELKKKYPKLKFGILNYVLNNREDYNLDVVCILDTIANDNIVMSYLKKGIKVFIYGIVGKINYQRNYENLYYIVDKKD